MLRNRPVLNEIINYYRDSFVANSIIRQLEEAFLAAKPACTAKLENAIENDTQALILRDPATREAPETVLSPHSPSMAVVSYRITHWLWTSANDSFSGTCKRLAVSLQHAARAMTGIDIHPGAAIGQRFIIDHGYGVVIGQTAVIGDDCYVLNGVTIGARGIADNPDGKRHPTLGDRVEVGAFARLLGPITVGDDVFIGPLTLVTRDIPANSRVTQRPVAESLSLPPSASQMPPATSSFHARSKVSWVEAV